MGSLGSKMTKREFRVRMIPKLEIRVMMVNQALWLEIEDSDKPLPFNVNSAGFFGKPMVGCRLGGRCILLLSFIYVPQQSI